MNGTFPEAYLFFLVHFHGDRDYFECHELLEQYWKEHPESPLRDTWAGLIQSAVGMYHYRRGNVAGAIKSLEGALRRSEPEQLRELGIDAERWMIRVRDTIESIQVGREASAYRDLDIPFSNEMLEAACTRLCEEMGFVWGAPSRMEDPELIHRHIRRDRSDVIEARRQALEERRASR